MAVMRTIFAVVTGSFLVLLFACSNGVEPVHDMNQTDAITAGQALKADSHSSARGLHIAGDGAFAAPCYTTTPATPTDADNDHFPDSGAAITYTNCVEGSAVYSGSGYVTDGNPSSATFDFTNAVNLDVAIASSGLTYTFASTQTGSQSGSTYSLDDAAVVDANVSSPTFTGTWHDEHGWSVSFTPDDGTWVPAPGTPVEAGNLSIGGAWKYQMHPGPSVSGAASGTLRTDATCPTAIVSGTEQVVFTNGQILQVTWTGCDQTQTELIGL